MNTDLTLKVMNGSEDGKAFWVCHYSRPDLNKKPLRNVPPTLCEARSNDEVKKTIYYSKSHFAPVGKNGKITQKAISGVDNTGYRMHSGNMLYAFESEQDCIDAWNSQLCEVGIRIQERIKSAKAEWVKMQAGIDGMKIKYQY